VHVKTLKTVVLYPKSLLHVLVCLQWGLVA